MAAAVAGVTAIALLVGGGTAVADPDPPADDPRARFGLPAPAPAGPPAAGDQRGLFELGEQRRVATSCADATSLPCPFDPDGSPAATTTRLSAAHLARLPLADADLAAVPYLVNGVGRDQRGPFFAGATSVDNRWTLDGAPIDSPRVGGLSTRVPLVFLESISVTTGGLSARDRVGTGALVDARLREAGDHHAAAGWLWLGRAAPARTVERAPGTYQPFDGRTADYHGLTAAARADGPLAEVGGVRLWYVAGVGPRVTDGGFTWRAYRLTDRDGDGSIDLAAGGTLDHELISSAERGALAYSIPILARLGARAGEQRWTATALITPAADTSWRTEAEHDAAGIDRTWLDAELLASWRGRWGAITVEASAAWHRATRHDHPTSDGGDAPAVRRWGVAAPEAGLSPDDDALRAGCSDASVADPYPLIANCPFVVYQTGGIGANYDLVVDRPAVTAELEHRLGDHTLAAGATGEDARTVTRTRLSGGVFRDRFSPDAYVDTRLVELGEGPGFDQTCGDAGPCRWLDEAERTVRTRYLAAWLTDTWRPGPSVAVEYGLRAERSQVGTIVDVRDLLPRVAAAWDLVGGRRSRLYAGWGRYAAPLPTWLGERLYGDTTRYLVSTFQGVTTSQVTSFSLPVADHVDGVRIDEALAGLELGVADVVRVGVGVRRRHLGRTLDDEDGVLATVGATGGERATRDLTEVTADFETSPTAATHVRLGYTWSRLHGNWPGPLDPIDGYNGYLASLFDRGFANATGRLPGDRPHRFFAEVTGRTERGGFTIDGSVRATAASGEPFSARTIYGQQFVIPRGRAGRLPPLLRTDLHLEARRGRVSVTLDLFNLFDRRAAIEVDQWYANLDAPLIVDGERADLVFAKDASGQPLRVNPRFGQPTRFQAPLAGVVGVHVEL